ncbi:MAG: glutathione transferase [Rhodospirillaceae bacterium]|nr:glutathione transferase [Rhodospirillaceae bacterium]|tara:strand:- start:556 stop:1188 length:633 start_codon:yes stop_codon:yes gene_type:complete
MKLYTVPGAPNPTKVMLYIAEREEMGVSMKIEQVLVNPIKGEQKKPEHLLRNEFGALPVLELDDGRFIVESLAIIYFLEDLFPENNMIGIDVTERGLARDIERNIEFRFSNIVGEYIHATNSPLGLEPNPGVAAKLKNIFPKALVYIEKILSDGRDLLGGEKPSIADCTLQSALQFARFAKVEVINGYPLVQEWDKRYRQRPAAKLVLKF